MVFFAGFVGIKIKIFFSDKTDISIEEYKFYIDY
jgi:hypothetical protein